LEAATLQNVYDCYDN